MRKTLFYSRTRRVVSNSWHFFVTKLGLVLSRTRMGVPGRRLCLSCCHVTEIRVESFWGIHSQPPVEELT
jgi:hypothetical protein